MQTVISGAPVVIVLLDSWGRLSRAGDANRIKKWIEISRGTHERRLIRNRTGWRRGILCAAQILLTEPCPPAPTSCFTIFIPIAKIYAATLLSGLAQPRKSLAPKYFYDARGSELFEAICALP
jgi:hypothetical protein